MKANRSLIISAFLFLLFASCNSLKKTTSDLVNVSKEEDALYTLVQHKTFQYFWDGAEPNSGMARERFHEDGIYPADDKNVVTSGGSGFGVMAILAGINQNFITREQGRKRLEKIVGFLQKADRFHGAWSHWIYGETGKVKPFGKKDDGGDLVETSFMLQGLLCVRQYFQNGTTEEKNLAKKNDFYGLNIIFLEASFAKLLMSY
jgi:hypothetical protein